MSSYAWFGRKTTLRINPDQIPDLHWKLADSYHTTNIGQLETKDNTVHDITLNTHMETDHITLSTDTPLKVDMNPLSVLFYLCIEI